MAKLAEQTSQIWPEGVQCVVLFTFDVDGETLWTSRNPENWNRPGNLAQGSYGPRIAMPKILDVLEKHDVKSTFFIPGWIIEKYPEMSREVLERGHEAAYHSYLHEFDLKAGYDKEKENLDRCLDIFDQILKIRPRGFRSPLYEISEASIRLMNEYDFLYSSSMMDDDFPYFRPYQGKPSKLVELPTQWMWEDASYFFFTLSEPVRRGISSCNKVFEIWTEEFDAIYENGAFLNLVFHPQICGRFSRVKLIDELISYMKDNPGTWITTAQEVAQFWRDRQG
jgi:peptidoglycan/xylan/chitin deacetylase (PgdA/CDA1 family)